MNIIKPLIDKKTYKHIILSNKLEVLLIYDETTDTSSAALTVGAGYYNDPIQYQGLAHFLEHMLFMGTQKYPKENYFNSYINKSGGNVNAQTIEESTTYFFEVLNEYFNQAIKIFSNFFVEPLLSEDGINREINAVHSEYEKNYSVDIVRIVSVLKEIVDTKDNPFYNFGGGNKQTLQKPDIRDELLKFYDKYYSSNIMKLVVLSNVPHDVMQKKITKLFEQVPNKNIISKTCTVFPFNTSKVIKIQPIQDIDSIYIFWQIRNMDKNYKYKPLDYLFHLLNSKNNNSMIDVLKKEQLCTKVDISLYQTDKTFHLVGFYAELTKLGMENYTYIISCVKSYIDMIKTQFSSHTVDELVALSDIHFNYSVIQDKSEYVLELSDNMFKYDIEHVIYGTYVMINDQKMIKKYVGECLKDMSKNIIILSSKSFNDCKLKDTWYDTLYDIIDTKLVIPKFNKSLSMPTKNVFIPYDLKLINNDDHNLNNDDIIWYKFDTFGIPKVFIDIIIKNNNVIDNIENYLAFKLYLSLFRYCHNDMLYYASVASVGYDISDTINGFVLTFYGYNNNIVLFVDKFMSKFMKFIQNVDSNVFEFIKNTMIQALVNYKYDPPYVLTKHKMVDALYVINYSDKDLLREICNINIDMVKNIGNNLNKSCSIEMLMYGNYDSKIMGVIDKFNVFVKHDGKCCNNKVMALDGGDTHTYIIKSLNAEENNYAIQVFYEIGVVVKNKSPLWMEKILCLHFMNLYMKEKFFTQLRTKEQSGYIVRSSMTSYANNIGSLYGLTFLIQSSHIHPSVLSKRIKKFVTEMYNRLLKIKDTSIDVYKNSIKQLLDAKFITQYDEHDFLMNEILSQTFAFDNKKVLSSNIDIINKQLLIEFCEMYFINKATRQVRICEVLRMDK